MMSLLENKLFVLILMIFLHIIEDFHLQGILASMKQIKWWEQQLNSEYLGKYAYDWVFALIVHSFEWAFIIMIPIFLVHGFNLLMLVVIILNMGVHFIVDHIKCNKLRINLIVDQSIHILQILLTWVIFIVL